LETRTQIKVTKKVSVHITADEIRQKFYLPDDCTIFVEVPGGGDWSNMELEIDGECPLKGRYEMISYE